MITTWASLSGDTAILLSAGWSPLKVFIFQLVSASTAFVGLYIGIAVSEGSEVVQQWIFVIAAGLFLYVALADVVRLLVSLAFSPNMYTKSILVHLKSSERSFFTCRGQGIIARANALQKLADQVLCLDTPTTMYNYSIIRHISLKLKL